MMRRPKTCARGFTLTELVVVIVIATILAAFAIARIDTRDFDAEGYANQVRAASSLMPVQASRSRGP